MLNTSWTFIISVLYFFCLLLSFSHSSLSLSLSPYHCYTSTYIYLCVYRFILVPFTTCLKKQCPFNSCFEWIIEIHALVMARLRELENEILLMIQLSRQGAVTTLFLRGGDRWGVGGDACRSTRSGVLISDGTEFARSIGPFYIVT